MLTFEQIKELIDQVASHRLSGIELERSGFRLKIDGQKPAGAEVVHAAAEMPAAVKPAVIVAGEAAAAAPAAAATAPAVPAAAPAAAVAEAVATPAEDHHILKSPIVGTFYRAPNPDSPAFAEVGDRVKKGQVLCIVEAMKLMNEIESDADGKIVKIHVENAQAVEYGEPLFSIA